jgi:hypothetical protein
MWKKVAAPVNTGGAAWLSPSTDRTREKTMRDPLLLTALLAAARVACRMARWTMMLYAERTRVRQLGRLSRAAGPGSTVARRDGGGWLVIARGEGE